MTLFVLLGIAFVQGITEFLPISSSAHLILFPHVFGVEDQGLIMDVAVHVGTLLAVMIYFRKDIVKMLYGLFSKQEEKGKHLFFQIVLATIPVVITGFFIEKYFSLDLRSIEIIAWATLIFGLLLYLSDQFFESKKDIKDLSYQHAFYIGLAQVLALIPGTSRSGVTITCARFLGYKRIDSAHFSMLLSIPTIIAAGFLTGIKIYQTGDMLLTQQAFMAIIFSFIAAFIAIWAMMAWLKKSSFTPFVIYRLILGTILLYYIYC